jgi:Tripartite tricarboxylate transporter TctB family
VLYFNLISLLLIVCGATVLGLDTSHIVESARVYPSILIGLVIVFSLIIAVKEIAGRAATAPLDSQLAKILRAPSRLRLRLLAFCAAWLIYPWGLTNAGFIAATTCAISLSLWLLKIKRPFIGVLAALMFSLTFSILFATVLFIPTPLGPLDELLSRLLFAVQH